MFDSFLEASRAPSGTAHEEHTLQVSLSPRPLSTPSAPIALCSPASSAQSLDLAFCCNLQTTFSTCPDLPSSGAYFWSSRPAPSSYFSVHRSSHPDLAWFGSSELSVLLLPLFDGTAALSGEPDEVASLFISRCILVNPGLGLEGIGISPGW